MGIIRIFRFLPLDGWPRRCTRCGVAFGVSYPALGHRVVAQVPDNVVITTVGVVRVCRCTLHRRNTRRRFARLVILFTLLLYLHHASGIVFLTCRNVVAADAIDIAELAYTEFTCYTFIADEVMLGKAVLCHSDNRSRINGVIFRFVERDSLWCTIDIYALKVAVVLMIRSPTAL